MMLRVVLLVVALFLCMGNSAQDAGLIVVFSVTGLQKLAQTQLTKALESISLEAAPFEPYRIDSAHTLTGDISLSQIVCDSNITAQLVPIGVLSNASFCHQQVHVNYQVHQGDSNGPILCSNSSSLINWSSDRISIYVAVATNSTSGGLRISVNRIEVQPGNGTLNVSCFQQPISAYFVSLAIANNLPIVLQPILNELVPPLQVTIPEIPSSAFLNMSLSQSPSIRPGNVSVFFSGVFYDLNYPGSGFGVSCMRQDAAGDAAKDATVDLSACFFNSLGIVLFENDVLHGSFEDIFDGIPVTIDVHCSRAPIAMFSANQVAVNTTLELEFMAFGKDQGNVLLGLTLPLNVSASASTIRAQIPPNLNVTQLKISISLDGFKLPLNATVLEPLLATFLDQKVIPAANEILNSGITVGFPLKSDSERVSVDGIQFEFDLASK